MEEKNFEEMDRTLGIGGIISTDLKVKMKSLSRVQLFVTPWTVAYTVSSAHGIFQARILEWVVIYFSRRSSQPRDRTRVSLIAGRFFTV